ncbi:hypothetical protein BDV96DRAFT_639216 [Lophiotrema nucula]|uniref:F-box domain-containing protein n=1 Tax=Lophiotrema nucula TaxID=690887 RepID=A0A6A5ZWJ1_9PLEO|nr:hypothetical protein BDV96DRAFT_639216 [Lophiotrema nucula]
MGKHNTGLMSLPEEILLRIANCVIGQNVRCFEIKYRPHLVRDLKLAAIACYDFALTNTRLHRIISPLLYTAVWNDTPFMNKLIRRVVNAPSIAQNIRYVCWADTRQASNVAHQEGDLYANGHPPHSTAEHVDQQTSIQEYDSMQPLQPPYFFFPEHDEDLAALLSLAPNTRWLEVALWNSDWSLWTNDQRDLILVWALCNLEIPRWLQYLSLATSPDSASTIALRVQHLSVIHTRVGTTPLSYISDILRLPSLIRLTLDRVLQIHELETHKPVPWHCPARSSSVRELYITESLIDTRMIARLLSSPRALVQFHLHFPEGDIPQWWAGEPYLPYPRLCFRTLTPAILQHRDSLKTLGCWGVTHRDSGFWPFYADPPVGRLGSLKSMHQLLYLGVHANATAMDELPKSLVMLELLSNAYQTPHEQQLLDDLASFCASTSSKLREVSLIFDDREPYLETEQGRRLIEQFLKEEVTVSLHNRYWRYDVHYSMGPPKKAFTGRYIHTKWYSKHEVFNLVDIARFE